ncbi:hypothetical protein, partial [Roseibacillus ishigakijimensis]
VSRISRRGAKLVTNPADVNIIPFKNHPFAPFPEEQNSKFGFTVSILANRKHPKGLDKRL